VSQRLIDDYRKRLADLRAREEAAGQIRWLRPAFQAKA
jgi:hypothetical protein